MARLIKVLIVDDSALIRQMLTRALALDPRIEIVGTAKTGVEAIELAMALAPDVITLDIEMPEMSGLEALPFIVRNTDARVVVLTSMDDPDTTYQSLTMGAVDFIGKPHGGFASSLSDLADVLIKKIKTAYRIDPDKRVLGTSPIAGGTVAAGIEGGIRAQAAAAVPDVPRVCVERPREEPVGGIIPVCIAASTGGPPALEVVLAGITPDLPGSYVVVQHLPHGFSASLVRRLSRITDLIVLEAESGAFLKAGAAYVAPYGTHTVLDLRDGRPCLRLIKDPPLHGVRPAADPLMISAAQVFGDRAVGVILTGMGSDGAVGLESMRQAGAQTIAQDEETSIVWGMPGAAVRRGAVRTVVPVQGIAIEVRRAVRSKAGVDD
jgi:two-component system, chemotaxis family, protein-glutamate methylesterase/glutaminase